MAKASRNLQGLSVGFVLLYLALLAPCTKGFLEQDARESHGPRPQNRRHLSSSIGHHGPNEGHHGPYKGHHKKLGSGNKVHHNGITSWGTPFSSLLSEITSNADFLSFFGGSTSNKLPTSKLTTSTTTARVVRPCTSRLRAPIVMVYKQADIASRLRYSNRQTVILLLRNSITLTNTILFDANYSCTIFRTLDEKLALTVSSPSSANPALKIWGTHNILIVGISFKISTKEGAPACENIPEIGFDMVCPVIHIYKSYGIQIAKGTTFGRIDMFRTAQSRLDNLVASSTGSFKRSPGVIRLGINGIGPKLIKSLNVISNNEVFGTDTNIVLVLGTIGVQVVNNFVHDYGFAGIRCGADVHYSGDCMLTTISRNYVFSTPGKTLTGDSAGIYFCTHWFNPGNVAECNYVIGGDHCYYLDYVTSGVSINGGVCAKNADGVKVNNGKWNVVKNLLVVSSRGLPGWSTCLTPRVNNCFKDPGTFWEGMRKAYYNSATINKAWPWMSTVCQEAAIGGISCNPRGGVRPSLTGRCSGLPTNNTLDLIVVDAQTRIAAAPGYKYCEGYPVARKLNSQQALNISLDSAQFNNAVAGDYGVRLTSPIYLSRKLFKSCPRALVGRRPVKSSTYYLGWNIPKPTWFDEMVNMSTKAIQDTQFLP